MAFEISDSGHSRERYAEACERKRICFLVEDDSADKVINLLFDCHDTAGILVNDLGATISKHKAVEAFGPLSTTFGACTLARCTVITEEIAGQTWAWRRLFHSPG